MKVNKKIHFIVINAGNAIKENEKTFIIVKSAIFVFKNNKKTLIVVKSAIFVFIENKLIKRYQFFLVYNVKMYIYHRMGWCNAVYAMRYTYMNNKANIVINVRNVIEEVKKAIFIVKNANNVQKLFRFIRNNYFTVVNNVKELI